MLRPDRRRPGAHSWNTRRPQRPLSCRPLPRITTPVPQLNPSQTPCWVTVSMTGNKLNAWTPYATRLAATSNSVAPTPPLTLCDHLPLHTRPETVDIVDLAAKGRLLRGDRDTVLLVRKPITSVSAPDGHYGRRSRPSLDDPVRI